MEWLTVKHAQLMPLCPDLVRFAAVARLEHLSGAADELGVPQSTVSRSVARVERAMGCRLFDREGRGLRLNRHGRAYLKRVLGALDELAAGADEVRQATDAPGELALGFLPSLGTAPVPQLVNWFRAGRPGVRFRLLQDNTDGLLARLRAGEVDLCLTHVAVPREPDVTATPVAREALRLVVPAGHRLAGRSRVRLAEARGEDFVMQTPGYGLRPLVDDLCAAAGFAPRVAFEGAELSTIRGLVAAGLGVAVLPPPLLTAPCLVDLPLTDPAAHRTIGLTHITTRHRTPVAADFAALVLDRAQECFANEEA